MVDYNWDNCYASKHICNITVECWVKRKWSDHPIVRHLFRDWVLFKEFITHLDYKIKTFGSLVSYIFRRLLYNNEFMISFCLFVGELTLKNIAFDKIKKIRDGPKNCDGPQKARFLRVLLCWRLLLNFVDLSTMKTHADTSPTGEISYIKKLMDEQL